MHKSSHTLFPCFVQDPLHSLGHILRSCSNGNVFRHEIFLRPLVGTFTSVSGFFDSSKRTKISFVGARDSHQSLRDGAGIDSDHSDLQRLGHSPDTISILREEVSREADFGVVCEFLSISKTQLGTGVKRTMTSSSVLNLMSAAKGPKVSSPFTN